MFRRMPLIIGFFFALTISGGFSDVRADPVVAFSNLPNPGNFTSGGAFIDSNMWKAIIFTTPIGVNTEIVSLAISLNCYGSPNCPTPLAYPVTVKIQIDLYSVSAGIPNNQLESLPMQEVTLNQSAQTLTFAIPHWQLSSSANYALVLKSTDAQKFKWAAVRVGGDGLGAPILPTAENGFAYNGINYATLDGGLSWTNSGVTNNNAVTLFVLLPSPVPDLSQWIQVLLALLMLLLLGWHYRQEHLD